MRTLPAELLARARELRRAQSNAEEVIWKLLRNRALDGFKFRRQKPFPPFIVDFFCPEKRLAIEIDGGQHADPDIAAYDQRRTEVLASAGVTLLRYWNNEVLRDPARVLEDIWHHLTATSRSP